VTGTLVIQTLGGGDKAGMYVFATNQITCFTCGDGHDVSTVETTVAGMAGSSILKTARMRLLGRISQDL
jgi:hypothetical protein